MATAAQDDRAAHVIINNDPSKHASSSRDRDSGVFLDDEETLQPSPASPVPSLSLKHTPSIKASTPTRTDSVSRRLQRPAELNLGFISSSDQKSELEKRYDLIRNSKSQNRAALKSPTQLLKDRLELSPKKKEHEREERVFVPPKETVGGCMFPGPNVRSDAFLASSVRAHTEKGRPSWWCKFDKLVVFDGPAEEAGKWRTRTSKGLSIARRRGDVETILIPLDCSHCQDMLNRTEWKYDINVCKRGVCWDCRERCRWEWEQEQHAPVATPESHEAEQQVNSAQSVTEAKAEANRERADSVLQDQDGGVQGEEELLRRVGIESAPRSPQVQGIEERLGE